MTTQSEPFVVLSTKAEAEQVIEEIEGLISMYKAGTVSDFLELVGDTSTYEDEKRGWTDTNGWEIRPHADGWMLTTSTPVAMPWSKPDVKFQHVMTANLAAWLDKEAKRMGTSRRGLMNVLLTQIKDSKNN